MNCQLTTKLAQSIIERVEISLKVSINLNDEVQNTLQSSDHFLEPAFTAKIQKHCSLPTPHIFTLQAVKRSCTF